MSEPTTGTQVEQLLERALDLPPAERERFLGQTCGSDAALRARLSRLLALAEQDDGFLDRSPLRAEASLTDDVSAVVASELAAGEMLGAYRVVGLIGRGGMGEVYRATRADGLFEKEVAVKVLRPDAVEHLGRFESERRILAGLEHPGIARLLDGGVTRDGRPYMQMEFVAGASITDHSRAHHLSLEQRLDLFRQCGEAVAFAHAKGVVHRDLKPSNILVTPDGGVKLLDFGVAKLLRPASGSALTTIAAPMTPAYAAPEQLQGKSVSAVTDIYALGVVLYELLTGRTPWLGNPSLPVSTLLYRILNDTAVPVSQAAREQTDSPVPAGLLTGDLDAILARCLRKNPAERYPTVADLLADLARYQKGEPITARVTTGTLPAHRDEAERRQLTVLFCDLVGSTALSEELDPEVFRDVLLAYQNVAAEVIGRYEGHIAQRLGDGLLIYFGYPTAHDDDAERAVRCGYDLVAALTRLDYKPPLAVRIGIHTGTVVVGQMGGTETLATGATTNLAARLQALAESNTVLISDATFKLVPGLFITKDHGTPALKGISKPVHVYQIIQPSGVRSRLEAATQLTGFVGREQEQALLLERWDDVGEGKGQAILFSAEPGLGKSRLLLVLRSRIAETPHTWLECRASPLTRNSAYQPVVELLQRGLAQREGDSVEERLQRLERGLDAVGFDKAEIIPLLAPLLDLSPSERYPPSQLGPELKRKRTLEALSAWILALARQQPLVIAFEDLHWSDASSLDLLGVLLEQIATVPVLLVMTTRPEFTSPWPARSHFATATLHPLRAAQAGQMLGSIAGGRPLPAQVNKTLVERAGGVPLFVEELTKALLESGQLIERDGRLEVQGELERLSIPSTLQDSLMARLDRLGPARDLIQTAAVIGHEIPYRLLQLVADLDERKLRQQLKQLTDAELLYLRGTPPQATYLFKHALIQDTAYHTLLKSTRQTLHEAIADALEQHFKEHERRLTLPEQAGTGSEAIVAGRREEHFSELAHHYSHSRNIGKAIEYSHLAGVRAVELSANAEAISHLKTALRFVETLPESPQRIERELALQTTLGPALIATKGYGALEVKHAYIRALELCRQGGESSQLFSAVGGLWQFHLVRAEFQRALELAEQLLTQAHAVQDPGLLLGAHDALGQTCFYLGEFAAARDHFEQSIAVYDPQQHRSVALLLGGEDPGVACRAHLAVALWFLGYPEQAQQRMDEACSLAQELNSPFDLGLAVSLAAGLHHLRRGGAPTVQERAEAAMRISSEHGFAFYLAFGTILRGWALAEQDQGEEGIRQMRQGLAACRATGAEFFRPHWHALLAEAYAKAGQAQEGLALLTEALGLIGRTRERIWEAELYRLKGELTLQKFQVQNPQSAFPNSQSEAVAEAEACFRQAIDIARRQNAKTWELRTATSLARLWQKQDRTPEAREVLKPVYDWFTEGFDTPDLVNARALLEALA